MLKPNTIICGNTLDVLRTLPSESVDCVITSPPYWALRDYGVPGQLGLEKTPEAYVSNLCDIFDEIKRVLKKEGTLFVNLGDTYYGGGRNKGNSKPHPKGVRGITNLGDIVAGPKGPSKSLVQIPSRFAIEMTNRGWLLRNELIWHKPNCMPASVTDRFTVDYEKLFFFVKSRDYFFNQQFEPSKNPDDDVRRIAKARGYNRREQGGNSTFNSPSVDIKALEERMARGRNKRSVWSVSTHPFKGAHFAVFPEGLIETPISAGSPVGGLVLDPFMGSGTTAVVAKRLGRDYLGIELNTDYIKMAHGRLS